MEVRHPAEFKVVREFKKMEVRHPAEFKVVPCGNEGSQAPIPSFNRFHETDVRGIVQWEMNKDIAKTVSVVVNNTQETRDTTTDLIRRRDILRMSFWWSLCTLCLLACQVE